MDASVAWFGVDSLGPLLDRSLTPALLIDDAGRCVDANRAACLLLRAPRSELVSRRLVDVVAPSLRADLPKRCEELMAHGTVAGRWALDPDRFGDLEVGYRAVANVRSGRHLALLSFPRGSDAVRPMAEPRLTRREREVLTLLAVGLDGRDIADALSISHPTVQTHVRNAKNRLGARTRTEAVVTALTYGELGF